MYPRGAGCYRSRDRSISKCLPGSSSSRASRSASPCLASISWETPCAMPSIHVCKAGRSIEMDVCGALDRAVAALVTPSAASVMTELITLVFTGITEYSNVPVWARRGGDESVRQNGGAHGSVAGCDHRVDQSGGSAIRLNQS